ncbi:MAG TPA: glycosyltransferase family 9 protein [Candidatus Edwardsbacteria bacterium]|nr:glycosyltransferase family 9 protein [Candidatus Edwardsbacteria bacterium]
MISGTGPIHGQQRVVAFVWGGLGNMVMALPMLAALRNTTTLAVVAQTGAMLELVDDGAFTAAIALDERRFKGLPGAIRLFRRLRTFRADVAISSIPAPRRHHLLARAAGAKRTLIPGPGQAKHLVYRNLAQLGQIGIDRCEPDHSLLHREDAAPMLRSLGIAGNEGIIGIFMGAGHAMRQWPRDRFEAVADKLSGQNPVIVFTGPDETSVERMSGRMHVFNGPLRQKLGLLAACRLFIGANTGLTHCAAALGVPTLELSGPTDPAVYGALGNSVAVVQGGAPCAPCYRSGNRYGCKTRGPDCMGAITVDHVLREAERMLAGRP